MFYSLKPKEECIEQALIFLEEMPYEFPAPELMIFPSGTLGFYWDEDTHGFYADVEILSGGKVAYFMKQGKERYKGVEQLSEKEIE